MFAVRQIGALGRGQGFGTTDHERLGEGWERAYREALADADAAWRPDAKLVASLDVPWGTFPAAIVLVSYIGELVVHAWDLAVATRQQLSIPETTLAMAYESTKHIPTDGRDDPGVPFENPTDAGAEATLLEQTAALTGRDVAAWR